MQNVINRISFLIIVSIFAATTAIAGEFDEFKRIAQATIDEVQDGKVGNIQKLIRMQSKLVKIGAKACRDHAAKRPADAALLNMVADNAEKMKAMTLEEIETAWHEKGYPKSKGIDLSKMEEESVAGSLLDTVVHPATAFIALKNYKESKDKKLLDQVHAELAEVLHHITLIK